MLDPSCGTTYTLLLLSKSKALNSSTMISYFEQNCNTQGNLKSFSPTHLFWKKAQIIDLCCGLGGLSLAAKQLGMQIVAGVDLHQAPLKTFCRNFPEATVINGSVNSKAVIENCAALVKGIKNDSSRVIILSGPPCQGFSMAGSRNPEDNRNEVLIAVAEAVAQLQPFCSVIENVSMVLAEKHSSRLSHFEQILRHAGYHVQCVLLDASEFGVSQKRKRAFFLITRKQYSKEEIMDRLAAYKIIATGAKEALHGLPVPKVRPDDYSDEKTYEGLFNHFTMRHSQAVKDKISAIIPGKGPMSYRRLHPTRPSNTLFSGHRAPPAHFSEPRSITVREAARLQGFPDEFRIYGSFANQMEQVTNAVPPPLARVVLRVLKELVNHD